MADLARAQLVRRTGVLVTYGLLTGLLLHVVATDLPWVSTTLANLGSTVPEDARFVDDPAVFAVLLGGTVAALLGLGAFLASRETATGFGLLGAATVAWTLFPYAEIPWAAVVGGPTNQTYQAPVGAWLVAGSIVALATVEISLSAREHLLAEIDDLGLDASPGSPARRQSLAGTLAWLTASLVLGSLATLAYALTRPFSQGLVDDPDLLWVPAAAGLVLGAALWLWARRG